MIDLPGERYARTRGHLEEVQRIASIQFDAAGVEVAERACDWAISCHLHQKDRHGGAPYVEHVTSVAARVLGWSTAPSPELAAAALLHDSVEDQVDWLAARGPATGDTPSRALAAIDASFGSRVRRMVERLTNPDFGAIACAEHGCVRDTPAFDAVTLSLYGLHFVEVFTADREAALIKLADFSDNALSLGDLRRTNPKAHAWLARKYGPCVAFLIDDLEALTDPRDPLFPIRETMLTALRTAWTRDYAPGGG